MPHRADNATASFVKPFVPPSLSASLKCQRVPRCNINRTSDSSREDEVAAKIAKLRKQKRLKSQKSSTNANDNDSNIKSPESSPDTSVGISFDDLPDWKKEEVLETQMADAERFFYGGAASPEREGSERPPNESDEYQPKVSTWGVFPRPDNISKTFGGGRRIQKGGVSLDSSESKQRDDAVMKKLAAYRASRGIDMENEEMHREEIEQALVDASDLMKRTLPYEAIEILEGVTEFTSDRSRLGGKVLLALALGYEAVGRRDDARKTYVRLRRNPFPDISGKAKQLLQGFAAMEQLQIDDETCLKGYRVTDFALPDLTRASDKRYETAVVSSSGRKAGPQRVSVGTSFGLFVVMGGPALILLALLIWRR